MNLKNRTSQIKSLVYMICIVFTVTACTNNKTVTTSSTNSNSSAVETKTQIDPSELNNTTGWKTVKSDSRFFQFSINIPPSARYYFSPDTVMGTENGVFIGEDRFPYGLTIEYNALNDRDSRTVTFKNDYAKSKPSDIDFGLPNAVVSEGINTRGIKYTRYLVRKDPNIYILSIQTNNASYIDAYKNMLKTLKIEK